MINEGARENSTPPLGWDYSVLLATGTDNPDSHRPTDALTGWSVCGPISSSSWSVRHGVFHILGRSYFLLLSRNLRHLITGGGGWDLGKSLVFDGLIILGVLHGSLTEATPASGSARSLSRLAGLGRCYLRSNRFDKSIHATRHRELIPLTRSRSKSISRNMTVSCRTSPSWCRPVKSHSCRCCA